MKTNTIAQTSFFGKLNNFINRVYYGLPLEFWLFVVSTLTVVNLILNYGTSSVLMALGAAILSATYLVRSNHFAGEAWSKVCKGIKLTRKSLPLLTLFAVLGGIFWITTVAETAQALIITTSGVTPIRNLINGTTFTGTATPALTTFADGIVLFIKLIFALLFLFACYAAYTKYNERAEFQEIIQAPVILFLVTLVIDGGMTIFFGP